MLVGAAEATATSGEAAFFAERRGVRVGLVVALFVAALAVRLCWIDEPLPGLATARVYYSAEVARARFFSQTESVPEWRREVARRNAQTVGAREPRIVEWLTVRGYRLAGAERIWIPRLLSIAFWLAGGVFLYLTARRIGSYEGALVTTAFFLFTPFGLWASRVLMPDNLMLLAMLVALYAIVRHHESPTFGRLLVAAVLSGAAVLIKPFCLFVLVGAFGALAIARRGLLRGVIDRRSVLYAVVAVAPFAAYLLWRTLGDQAGAIGGTARESFRPGLLLTASFWSGWAAVVGQVVGFAAFLGALAGVALARKGAGRPLLLGLWPGYVVFGLVFTHQIHTHTYYSLQLVPVVALSLGPVGAAVLGALARTSPRWHGRVVGWAVLVLAVVIGAGVWLFSPGRAEQRDEVKALREIGELTGHSTAVLFLPREHAMPLAYHAEIAGEWWPRRTGLHASSLPADKLLAKLRAEHSPEFFVVTDRAEFEANDELRRLLTERFPLLAETRYYLIFDLREPPPAPEH
jgi:hypothetical protein